MNSKYQRKTLTEIKQEAHERGIIGEDKACEYLKQQKYSIISRNWRTKKGEIDIIALKDDCLIFVEVKTLPSGNLQTLEQILGKIKQKRITETSKCFLSLYRQYSNSYIRFDVIVIDMPGFDSVYHLENAFTEYV